MLIIFCTTFASSSYDISVVKFALFCIPGTWSKVWPVDCRILPRCWLYAPSCLNIKPEWKTKTLHWVTGWYQAITAQLYSYDAIKINYRLVKTTTTTNTDWTGGFVIII